VTYYLDLLILFNFLIDGLLLWLTAQLCKFAFSYLRTAVAASVGSIYAVLIMCLPTIGWLTSLGLKWLIAIVMLIVAFRWRGIWHFVKTAIIFYFISSAMAGIMFSLSLQSQSIAVFVSAFLAAFIILYYAHRYIMQKQHLHVWVVPLHIAMDEVCVRCRGLIDTGNQLRDPLTGTPVSVMQIDIWRHLLPAEWREQTLSANRLRELIQNTNTSQSNWARRFVLIPYRTVRGNNQEWMVALRVDSLSIQLPTTTVTHQRALIGITDSILSPEGQYEAIIHPACTESKIDTKGESF
jgi:stage II sporulation protein GA (sporulation sigma-E factor processing peptidase)